VRVADPAHWEALPDGHTRATTTGGHEHRAGGPRPEPQPDGGALRSLLVRAAAAHIHVGQRPLSVYDQLAGTRPFTSTPFPVTGEGRPLSELVTARIRATAAKLGLSHLGESITSYVSRADASQMAYLDFLDLVLEEELAVGEERRFRHALRLSKMPHHKTVEEYDFAYQPELDPRKVRDLATLSFVETKTNVALLGPPGVGKTHLAVALAVAACRAGFTVYFTTLDDMVRQLKAADAIGRLASKIRSYLRPNLLVIDLCRHRDYAEGLGIVPWMVW
jgi:IstB-like ATP binding protein